MGLSLDTTVTKEYIAWKMEAVYSSEMLVSTYKSTALKTNIDAV
jgi:hypothetical protein